MASGGPRSSQALNAIVARGVRLPERICVDSSKDGMGTQTDSRNRSVVLSGIEPL